MSTVNTARTGVIANKIGMTRIYDEFGRSVPVTVLQLDNVQVTARKTKAKDGYNAVQLGAGKAKKHRVAKAQLAVFAKNNIEAKKKLAEFRVAEDALLPVGQEIRADHFVAGQYIDVIGITKGKGFAGAMVRWNSTDRPTTFVSATQVTAAIAAADVAAAGTAQVTVFNPGPGGGLSPAQSFTISTATGTAQNLRSEERRVGKECWYRC